MKTKTVIYRFVLALFCATTLNAQSQIKVNTLTSSYFNGLTKQTQTIVKYVITNNSDEDYLTWVALTPNEDKSDARLIDDFFFRLKGDFNYVMMLYDGLLDGLSEPFNINIGYSFLKKIRPDDTFTYIIAKTDEKSHFYEDRIVVVNKNEAYNQASISIDEKYFFKPSSIFLVENGISD